MVSGFTEPWDRALSHGSWSLQHREGSTPLAFLQGLYVAKGQSSLNRGHRWPNPNLPERLPLACTCRGGLCAVE